MKRNVTSVMAAFAVLCASALPTLSSEKAGISSVVNPQAEAFFGDVSTSRTIEVGDNVYRNETISTDAQGQVQLLFVDKTSLTIGPNSEVVIDEFVYNPDQNSSTMAISMTQGVFRFVGGQASKTEAVDVKTPQATIGIRGGIMLCRVEGDSVQCVFLYGDEMTVTSNNGDTASVTRYGFMVTIGPDGTITIDRASDDILGDILVDLQDQTDETVAEGTTIEVVSVDDDLLEYLDTLDAAGLGSFTLEELEDSLGLDDDKFDELGELIETFLPEPDPKGDDAYYDDAYYFVPTDFEGCADEFLCEM